MPTHSGMTLHVGAQPIYGPSNHIYAVSLWSSENLTAKPPFVQVGTLDLDPRTGIVHTSPTLEHLLGHPDSELGYEYSLSEFMFHFDRWDDRSGLLGLLDISDGSNQWSGTATTAGSDRGTRRHLYVVAKATGTGETRIVRAVVHDLTPTEPPPPANLGTLALTNMRTLPGHTVGIVDLRTWLIHHWVLVDRNAWAERRFLDLRIHPDDLQPVARCRAQLLASATTMSCIVRIRFSEYDDWIALRAQWTTIPYPDRPQAMIDVVPVVPQPD